MEKWVIWIIIILVISIIITGAYIFLIKPQIQGIGESWNDIKAEDGEQIEVELNNPVCDELVLNIEKVDCLVGERGINVSVFRREDNLGEGSLVVNVTDKQGEARELKKSNFSSGSLKLSFYNSVAGAETSVNAQLELAREGKLIICPGANLTYECEVENTAGNETSASSSLVPNPTGSIKALDIRDEYGEYYCTNQTNKTINPEHGIRVYAYQKINNTEVLSSDYIESDKVTNVCKYYPGIIDVWYSLKWEWDKVENVSGYYVYQYYSDNYNNITREYDYYTRVFNNNILRDTGLGNLWQQVK